MKTLNKMGDKVEFCMIPKATELSGYPHQLFLGCPESFQTQCQRPDTEGYPSMIVALEGPENWQGSTGTSHSPCLTPF